MASMTDEELTNLMGPASGTTAKRRKKKKAIPAFGSLAVSWRGGGSYIGSRI